MITLNGRDKYEKLDDIVARGLKVRIGVFAVGGIQFYSNLDNAVITYRNGKQTVDARNVITEKSISNYVQISRDDLFSVDDRTDDIIVSFKLETIFRKR